MFGVALHYSTSGAHEKRLCLRGFDAPHCLPHHYSNSLCQIYNYVCSQITHSSKLSCLECFRIQQKAFYFSYLNTMYLCSTLDTQNGFIPETWVHGVDSVDTGYVRWCRWRFTCVSCSLFFRFCFMLIWRKRLTSRSFIERKWQEWISWTVTEDGSCKQPYVDPVVLN